MNRYQKFYGGKQVSELLEQLLAHRLEIHPLDTQWYDALIVHLKSLNLQGQTASLFDKILALSVLQLNASLDLIRKELATLKKEEEEHNPFVIDPRMIVDAGKNIKVLAYVVSGVLLFALAMALIMECNLDYSTRSSLYGFIIISGILAHIIILLLLFSTGNKLEKSVKRKLNQ